MSDSQRIIDTYDRQAASLAELYHSKPSMQISSAIEQLVQPPRSEALALDVGAGAGRNAGQLASLGYEVIAVEPAAGMRAEGIQRHPSERIRWVDDRLPALSRTHQMGLLFDLILLSAVWQHVAPPDRARAFRKLITLMKPGALLLMTLRHGPAPPDRPMHSVSLGEVESLARSHGLELLRVLDGPDRLGREEVRWTTVCLRMPDDGSGALPLIRGIILSDEKSSTYKLGLLRAVSRIAEYAPAAAESVSEDDAFEVPLGLVALFWVRMYLPLVRHGLPQLPGNRGPDRLGFAKAGFRALLELEISPQDLRIGSSFNGERASAVMAAIGEAANTIASMPANFIKFPHSQSRVFDAARSRRPRSWGGTALELEGLREWGHLRVPGPVWRAMIRLGSWIEPVLVTEWARLIRTYAERMGLIVELGVAEAALAWNEPSRDTTVGRIAVERLLAGSAIKCVWSGAELTTRSLDIDHCLPWSAWPCGDLWNLMPAHRRLNQYHKRDRLPSAPTLSLAKERILDWWSKAWLSDPALQGRFYREAAAALPLSRRFEPEEVFAGLEWRRLRLRHDQQVPEWEFLREMVDAPGLEPGTR